MIDVACPEIRIKPYNIVQGDVCLGSISKDTVSTGLEIKDFLLCNQHITCPNTAHAHFTLFVFPIKKRYFYFNNGIKGLIIINYEYI